MFRLKTLVFLLVVASIVLTACQPAAAPQQPSGAETAGLDCAPNFEYSDLVVGFLQTGSEGGWRAANTASFKETAEQLGLTLKFYDSQNDLARQVAGFHQFIEDPLDLSVPGVQPLVVQLGDHVVVRFLGVGGAFARQPTEDSANDSGCSGYQRGS